jgi:hypothetical protein
MDRLSHAITFCQIRKEQYPIEDSIKKQKTHFYFITCEGFTKIGYASNIKERFSGYKVHNPFEVSIKFVSKPISKHDAKKLEAHIFETYYDHHVRGEWFKFTNNQLSNIKRLITACYDDCLVTHDES